MAKRKDSAALFEVINRGKAEAPLQTPSWLEKQPEAVQPAPAKPSGGVLAKPLRQPPGMVAEAPEPGRDCQPPGELAQERMWAIADGRLRLNLTYASASAVGLALVVLLATAWSLGRISATPDSGTATAPPGVEATQGQAEQPDDEWAALYQLNSSNASLLKENSEYVVVQSGVLNNDDALGIVKYLYDKGYKATAIGLQDGRLMVWDTADLTGVSQAEREAYCKRLESLGRGYPGYNFRDPYVARAPKIKQE